MLAALVAVAVLFACVSSARAAHSTIWLNSNEDLVGAQVDVRVERAAAGTSWFWAIMPSWKESWAHGGPQVYGDGTRWINWGGLDWEHGYQVAGNELAMIRRIQNGPGQLVSSTFRDGQWYRLRVERTGQVTFPPGSYRVSRNEAMVYVPEARTMWAWRFTMTDESGGVVHDDTMHVSEPSFRTWTFWSEVFSALDCTAESVALWRDPQALSTTGTWSAVYDMSWSGPDAACASSPKASRMEIVDAGQRVLRDSWGALPVGVSPGPLRLGTPPVAVPPTGGTIVAPISSRPSAMRRTSRSLTITFAHAAASSHRFRLTVTGPGIRGTRRLVGSNTRYVIRPLRTGSRYRVCVVAINAAGDSSAPRCANILTRRAS